MLLCLPRLSFAIARACAMARTKKKPGGTSSLPNFGGANLAELQQLAALLPLLRSGVLSQLVSDVQTKPANRTSKAEKLSSVPLSSDANGGWKPAKQKKVAKPKETPKPDVSAPGFSVSASVQDQLQ